MKTRILSYGGGVITGVLLVMLFSASSVREKADVDRVAPPAEVPGTEFHLVPLREFLTNVARYRQEHAMAVSKSMSRKYDRKIEPSRMFIYSVPVLEAFFNEIRAYAYQTELNPNELAIRFYYAVYPEGRSVAGHDYGLLHTLYMSPNYWSEAEQKYKDIDIKGLAEKAKKLGNDYAQQKDKLIKDSYLEKVDKSDSNAEVLLLDATAVPYMGPLPSRSGSSVPYPFEVINQGQLCPPNCPRYSLIEYSDSKYGNGL